MKILSLCTLFLTASISLSGAELAIHNRTRNIQASNSLYDSINAYPGDQVCIQLNQLKYAADTFLWYIEDQEVIKTEKPSLEWTVGNSCGLKNIMVIAMDKRSRIDGSSFKLFVGSFEAPVVSIKDGAKRPCCPLLLKANVLPYSYAVVPADIIKEYNWKVEKDGKILGEYTTNVNELEIFLPQEAGVIELTVSAIDANSTQSPATRFPIQVRAW